MKQAKKLTYEMKLAVSAYDLNPDNWALLKDGDVYITIINKTTQKTRIIDKLARPRKGGRFNV